MDEQGNHQHLWTFGEQLCPRPMADPAGHGDHQVRQLRMAYSSRGSTAVGPKRTKSAEGMVSSGAKRRFETRAYKGMAPKWRNCLQSKATTGMDTLLPGPGCDPATTLEQRARGEELQGSDQRWPPH